MGLQLADDYIQTAVQVSGDSPVLIDQYLRDAIEVDVDAIRQKTGHRRAVARAQGARRTRRCPRRPTSGSAGRHVHVLGKAVMRTGTPAASRTASASASRSSRVGSRRVGVRARAAGPPSHGAR